MERNDGVNVKFILFSKLLKHAKNISFIPN